jgi:hypothetical protein
VLRFITELRLTLTLKFLTATPAGSRGDDWIVEQESETLAQQQMSVNVAETSDLYSGDLERCSTLDDPAQIDIMQQRHRAVRRAELDKQ